MGTMAFTTISVCESLGPEELTIELSNSPAPLLTAGEADGLDEAAGDCTKPLRCDDADVLREAKMSGGANELPDAGLFGIEHLSDEKDERVFG